MNPVITKTQIKLRELACVIQFILELINKWNGKSAVDSKSVECPIVDTMRHVP